MAVTAKWYGLGQRALVRKEVHWTSDTIKALLTSSTYVPNQDTHGYLSDVTNEITGTGYSAGGVTLTSKTDNYDAGSNRIVLGAANISWPSATFAARNLIVYDDTPSTNATKPLLGFVDFGVDQTPAGITFSVLWDVLGVLNLAAS